MRRELRGGGARRARSVSETIPPPRHETRHDTTPDHDHETRHEITTTRDQRAHTLRDPLPKLIITRLCATIKSRGEVKSPRAGPLHRRRAERSDPPGPAAAAPRLEQKLDSFSYILVQKSRRGMP